MGILETPHDSHHFDGDAAAKAAQVSILSREKLEETAFSDGAQLPASPWMKRGQVEEFKLDLRSKNYRFLEWP